ncbi:MAG: hypothetical protein A2046_13590 [Bacteroidetes bacterium GWA2_30_7]|nr:MAG: hypothetical protein A2046_13590 [Bacteroidetes bacterium GWA2_30_7]
MLPKFLIADNSQELPDNIFVLHTESPKFLVKFNLDDITDKNIEMYWFDKTPDNKKIVDELIKDSEEFLINELENQENFLDESEN